MIFSSFSKKLALWYGDSILRFIVAAISISAVATYAATSYDVSNAPQMYLDSSITATQTTGIVLSAPVINGSYWTFTTTTGGVLRIRSGTYREDIYYGSASVNATTYKVTLSGVTRNLCPDTITFTSCGDGRRWGKGAIVELIQDQHLFDLKLNSDRINTTGTGFALRGSSTTFPLVRFNSVTTAQRTAMTAGNGDVVYDSTLGALYQYVAGAWAAIGDTGTSNATESAAGKVQLASTGSMLSHNLVGSSGASEVLQTRYVTSTGGNIGSGSIYSNAFKIPMTNSGGRLAMSLLGTGSALSSTVLHGNGAWSAIATSAIGGYSTRGNLLWSNGSNWTATGGIIKPTANSYTDESAYQVTSASLTPISSNLTRTVNVNTGSLVMLNFVGTYSVSQALTAAFDFNAGGGSVAWAEGATTRGRPLIWPQFAASANAVALNLTIIHRVQTGGLLTFTPTASVSAGNIQFNNDKFFQVIKLSN